MNEFVSFLPSLLIFVAGLSVLVLVHEVGHFLVARRFGIKVEEFGLGFPPRLWAKKKGDTVYSLNAIPVGGFVKLYGEDESVKKDKEHAYYHKGKIPRAVVVVAGVLMNYILALIVFSIVAWYTTGYVKLNEIQADTPAERAGLKAGDKVLKVNDKEVYYVDQFYGLIKAKQGQEVSLSIKRDGKTEDVKVTPRKDPPEGQGFLGVGLGQEPYPLDKRPLMSVKHGFGQTLFWIGMTFQGVKIIAGDIGEGRAPEGVSGPVGILRVTDAVVKYGVIPLLSLMGIISVNLAVLNLLPIPALDGGRLLFIAVETFFGRKVLPTFEKYAHTVGFVLLIALILLTTFKDLANWVSGKDIFGAP